ncbi:MAG: metallophosphoesterase family protein [Thermoleophilia bacterium]|nr:metallophosphoesterase family protein [Thermoleophilia bacterium]
MRVGLIGDVHGNLLALDAALDDLSRDRLDTLVCLGDVVVGPQPVETLARIRSLGCRVVLGNWDAYCLRGFPRPTNGLARRLLEIGRWSADQLGAADREYIATFEPMVELEAPGTARVVTFHGSPRSDEDPIFATTPEDELERMLAGVVAPLLVAGHTHFQMVRRYRDSLVLNPGSVGLAFRRQADVMPVAKWAEYGVVALGDDGLAVEVELRRRPYDVDALVKVILDSRMPHSAWWAALWTSDAVDDGGCPNPSAFA